MAADNCKTSRGQGTIKTIYSLSAFELGHYGTVSVDWVTWRGRYARTAGRSEGTDGDTRYSRLFFVYDCARCRAVEKQPISSLGNLKQDYTYEVKIRDPNEEGPQKRESARAEFVRSAATAGGRI